MLSILDVQSVLEGDTYVDTEWESFNQSSSLALMRNVSMTQPMVSAADVFTHNCKNFSYPTVHEYGLWLILTVSNTTNTDVTSENGFDSDEMCRQHHSSSHAGAKMALWVDVS